MMCFSKWIFRVCLLTCLLTVSVSEDQQITVKTGDDVTLQCLDHRGGGIKLLVWRRQDLVGSYIFFFRDDRTYENYQHPSFHGRVELRDQQMKDGDVSVILKNVTIEDTGTYECYVKNSNISTPPQLITNINLTVTDSGGAAGHTEDGGDNGEHAGLIVGLLVVGVFVVIAVTVGLVIFRKHKSELMVVSSRTGLQCLHVRPSLYQTG